MFFAVQNDLTWRRISVSRGIKTDLALDCRFARLTAALWSNTWGVMCHFQTNNPFSYRLGSTWTKVRTPVQNRGCWKHTTAPLFRALLLQWTRFGLRLLFSFSCCSWGQPLLLPPTPKISSPFTLRDDFVNETMHVLSVFMMVMTSSGRTKMENSQ